MGAACIRERLDRALCSQSWLDSFPETLIKHFTDQGSDHRALVLSDKPYVRNSRPLFRFDACWAKNPEVRAMVTRDRRRRNFVAGLQNEAGEWITDEKGKTTVAIDFYRHLFTSESQV
ncbi:unnamed protein product [Linum trigynum]|uniref:Uncharacterized protein n=1 Tax=Linum trigynum TaxID=586398 RepID=A0AAV2E619_9ROSI